LARVEEIALALLLEIPNITLAQVPAGGRGEQHHRSRVGHAASARRCESHTGRSETALGLFDSGTPRQGVGSASCFTARTVLRLVRALLNYFMDVHRDEHGYEEILAAAARQSATMTGTGQLPKFEDERLRHAD